MFSAQNMARLLGQGAEVLQMACLSASDESPRPSFSVVCCSISVGDYRGSSLSLSIIRSYLLQIHYIYTPLILLCTHSEYQASSQLQVQQHDQMVPQPTLSGSQVCRIYPPSVGQVTGAVLSIILTSGTCWVIPPSTQHQHWGEEWTMWLVSSVRGTV